ncbi:hypothetical protein AN167_26580, partial [Vibrio splendidus]
LVVAGVAVEQGGLADREVEEDRVEAPRIHVQHHVVGGGIAIDVGHVAIHVGDIVVLQGAALHADGQALEALLGGGADLGVAGREPGRRRGDVGLGEQHLFTTLLVDGHRGHDGVVLARHQAGNDAIPALHDPLAVDADLGTQGVAQVDVEAGELAVRCTVLHGLVGYVDADTDVAHVGVGRAGHQ